MSASRHHHVPAIHAVHIVELASRWAVTPEKLLSSIADGVDELTEPGAKLDLADLELLVARARSLTKEPALGFHLGMNLQISAFGYLGLAAMTAPTLGDAIGVVTRYAPTLTSALRIEFHREGQLASLTLHELADFGSARDAVVLSVFVAIWQLGSMLVGERLKGDLELAFPVPAYAGQLTPHAPGDVRFDRPQHRLVFDASVTELRPRAADPAAFKMLTEQCERELVAMGERDTLRAQVRDALARSTGRFPTLTELGAATHLSPRSLKRKLAAEGTSFSTLLGETRQARAMLLLRDAELTLDEIAERLGYSDAANFSRAFRRWTGSTPAQMRR